jgi:hypothetical protein
MAVQQERRTTTNRNLVWIVVLGVIVLGLAGWIVFDLFFSATTAPNAELAQVVADYTEAWETSDTAAFATTVSDDYQFVRGDTSTGAVTMQFNIGMDNGFRVEPIGRQLWSGDGPEYYVSIAETIYSDSDYPGPEGVEGMSTVVLVEDGDTYQVVRHVWFGLDG